MWQIRLEEKRASMQTCQGEFVQDLEARRALFLNQPPLEFFTSTATKSEYQEDEINL